MSHYHLEHSIRGSQHGEGGAGEEKGRPGRAEYRRPACSRCIITKQSCFLLAAEQRQRFTCLRAPWPLRTVQEAAPQGSSPPQPPL